MAFDAADPRAGVLADLPWHVESPIAGTLRIVDDALVITGWGTDDIRAAIPLGTIDRTTVETTFGTLPTLRVWHTLHGREFQSRFDFNSDESDPNARGDDSPSGLTDRIGPGIARDAAQRLEGGLRALGGGLNLGMRTARQAVDGLARQEEYKAWPAAIAAAQARARTRRDGAAPKARPISATQTVPYGAKPPTGGPTEALQWFRDPLLGWLGACATRARELNVRGIPVIQPRYPLDSPICRIVVLGEFSRGKSTLINALFGIHGEIALPTGMTPTTPIACALRVPRMGEADGATVTYRGDRPSMDLSIEDFRRGVRLTEGESAGASDGHGDLLHLDEARSVEIRITGAYLPAGVEIEDTPGLHEDNKRSAGAMAALGRADLVLFVLAADQLLSELERDVIHEQLERGNHRNVLFLVNFWDSIDDGAQRELLRSRATAILGDFPSPFRHDSIETARQIDESGYVFFVSALQAARQQRQHKNAPEESGIPRLRALLRDLLGPGSDALLLRARVGRALRYAALLRQAVSKSSAAAAAVESPAGMRPKGQASAGDEAVVAAIRVLDGLPGAVSGAISSELANVDVSQQPEIQRAIRELEAAARSGGGSAVADTRRLLASDMRTLAARSARLAQDAVDLILAQARAAYLGRNLEAPALDARIDPMSITVPTETDARVLLVLLQDLPRILRDDLDEKARRVSAVLAASVRDAARGAHSDSEARDATSAVPVDGDRVTALRSLEGDLLRIERFLQTLLVQ